MSIEMRKIKGTQYVTETRRVGKKVVKTHLGKLDENQAEFLYRKGQLQAAMRKRLREETDRSRKASDQIQPALDLLIEFGERQEVVSKLSHKCNWSVNSMSDNPANMDADHIRQSIDALPSKKDFEELGRCASMGDPTAMETFDRLVEKTPELLDSIANLVELAKSLVIQDMSANSYLMKLGIEHKVSTLLKSLNDAGEVAPIELMNAEILVIAYLDTMRCGLLACRRYDTKSDAEHFQRLAERSQKRYERAQATYLRCGRANGK